MATLDRQILHIMVPMEICPYRLKRDIFSIYGSWEEMIDAAEKYYLVYQYLNPPRVKPWSKDLWWPSALMLFWLLILEGHA